MLIRGLDVGPDLKAIMGILEFSGDGAFTIKIPEAVGTNLLKTETREVFGKIRKIFFEVDDFVWINGDGEFSDRLRWHDSCIRFP